MFCFYVEMFFILFMFFYYDVFVLKFSFKEEFFNTFIFILLCFIIHYFVYKYGKKSECPKKETIK